MGGYGNLVAALAVFALTHSVPALRPVRALCVSALGERAYLIVYSMISVLVIAWMVSAALAAPYLELWPMTVGVMWATAIVMLIATVLTVFGLTTPNPFSIPVKPDQFDPENPGILALTRHPLLLGLALWAGAHVLSNGALSAVILFGFAFVFSLAGMGILDARRKRHWGENVWNSRAAQTTLLSIRVQRMPLGDWRWVLVAVLYGAMIGLHPIVIGVQPLPL